MSIKIKTGPKIVLGVLAIVGILLILRSPAVLSHLPSNFQKAVAPDKVAMPSIQDAQVKNVTPIPPPSSSPANVQSTLYRIGIWEWNAQNGFIFSVGGKCTTKGSLAEKFGVNICLERQDDTGKMGEGIIACAKELKEGAKQCSTGYNAVIIMSGGVPQFSAINNKLLADLGPEWKLKVIAAVGRSAGEDGYWAPASFKKNPHSIATTEMEGGKDDAGNPVTGLLVGGVIRDDDWNIALKHAGDNGLKNNPDEKTFDPDAVNWINEPDYNTAAADYVAAKCEDRVLVKDGHATGKKVHVCMNGVVTWTPGDVTLATKRGGLVKVASSKDYLMGAVIIGPNKFFSDNHDETVSLIAAALAGGDQVRAYDKNLKLACKIAAEVYNDQGDTGYSNGDYWYKYAKGVHQNDAKGNAVDLGGSAVYGMEDNLIFFGVKDGTNDNFRSIYNQFAKIDLQQYPQLFTAKTTPIPPVSEVESKAYLADAKDKIEGTGSSVGEATSESFDAGTTNGDVIGNRSYSINFATGSAQPLPDGMATINELKDSLAVTRASIELNGHTDNTGNPAANQSLSQARAQAVADALHAAAPASFPRNRFVVHGYGSSKPIADNSTAEGKAQNRRVEVILRAQ